MWPTTADALIRVQRELAELSPPPWRHSSAHPLLAGCHVSFTRRAPRRGGVGEHGRASRRGGVGERGRASRRGGVGKRGWAAAVLMRDGRLIESAVAAGVAGAPYEPGKLALREGPLLEAAVRALREPPELLIVHAAGRDHPRGAGLALHLGAALDLPSIGVTDRPLGATGAPPPAGRGATSRLVADGVEVARMLRTRAGARPVVVHAGWRTDLDTATWGALAATRDFRTPEPLRCARRLARHVRAAAESR